MSLDFQKAFDTISKSSILAALKMFNFGPVFSGYVETILNDTEAAIKNGGWISEFFQTSRGVRQGCCLSPLLFVIVVELLAIKIRHDPQISGILENTNVPHSGTKLIQYADDMNLFVKTTDCIRRTLEITDEFETFTGLALNRKKSIGMGLGKNKGITDPEIGITWKKRGESIKVLGVFFNASTEASLLEENWKPKFEDMKRIMNVWSRRNLSLFGKCIVIKTFLLSKISYILQSLCLPDSVIERFDALFFRFLWKNKGLDTRAHEKIKRSVLCLDRSEGGINMISIRDQQQVMLIRWIQKGYVNAKGTQQLIIDYLLRKIGGLEYVVHSFAHPEHFVGVNMVKSMFWQKAIRAWLNLNCKNRVAVINVPIFSNNNIMYKNKSLFIPRWIKMNIKYVHNVVKNGAVMTLGEVRDVVGNYGGLLPDYLAVYNAIVRSGVNLDPPPSCCNLPPEFLMDNKSLRLVIVKQKDITMPSAGFWGRRLGVDLKNHFLVAVRATKETRLRCLHTKLVHNIYPTNFLLKKMYLKDSNICDFCDEIDYIDHSFYNCRHVKEFWKYISSLISTSLNTRFDLTVSHALLGLPIGTLQLKSREIKEINHFILVAKLAIIKSKAAKSRNLKICFENEFEFRKLDFQILNV